MLKGKIIYNGFWNTSPPNPVVRLMQSAEKKGIVLDAVPNSKAIVMIDGRAKVYGFMPGDFAIFWDKDMRLAKTLESIGVRLYNNQAAIALCDDKFATHLALAQHGLPMPKTVLAPMTYRVFDRQAAEKYYQTVRDEIGFPMIVKECFGSLGGQVYFAQSMGELVRIATQIGDRPFFCQQFIDTKTDEFQSVDLRLYVVGGEVKAAMKRCHPSDFRANISNGGMGIKYTPDAREIELAVKCSKILGLCFCGVDIILDRHGKPYICEVNSNAQMAGITGCTGVSVADDIIDFVIQNEAEVQDEERYIQK